MTDLTREQKARLVAGATTWTTHDAPGLRALRLADGPHGLRTQGDSGDALGLGDSIRAVCFPPAVALGATWNPALVERVGRALGDEACGLGVDVLLGPGLNIKRSPLGGRNFEYLSEDPRLTGTLAAALVRGIQSRGVAATPKHFAVNNQETDRMRVDAVVSDRALREIYLAGFEQVVRDGRPRALMSAYNRIGGIFASENRWLLTEVLREEWGFDGLVMSDWGAVNDPVAAVAAGLDLEMPPSGRADRIVAAADAGDLDETVVDTAVDRLRTLASRTSAPSGSRDIDAAQQTARDAAREAVTLLHNDGALPLGPGQRVLVVGEFARTPRFQGGGSSRVVPTRTVSALEGLRAAGVDVAFEPGFSLARQPDATGADAAVTAASDADVVVAFCGLPDHAESEGFDRTDLALPADQLTLLQRLKRTGTPLVVVLSNGSVVDVASWRDGVSAIVEGWLLGQEGGQALAEVLTGAVNPSGRLAETIPLRLEDHPSYPTFPGRDGQAVYGDDVFVGYRGFDMRGTDVAYPFGFGLSYTTFAYDKLTVTETGRNRWRVEVTVRNTGSRAGAEVVQLYVAAPAADVARPVRELRGFAKVFLQPGEATTARMELVERDLAFWNTRAGRWHVAAGRYRFEIGASSRDIHLVASVDSAGDGVIDPLRPDSTVGEWARHPAGATVIERFRAALPAGAADAAPELQAIVEAMPLRQLTTWGVGITDELIDRVVAEQEHA